MDRWLYDTLFIISLRHIHDISTFNQTTFKDCTKGAQVELALVWSHFDLSDTVVTQDMNQRSFTDTASHYIHVRYYISIHYRQLIHRPVFCEFQNNAALCGLTFCFLLSFKKKNYIYGIWQTP